MAKLSGFGPRLAALRMKAGLTQREVAEKSGVNLRTYQTYEIEARDISAGALLAFDQTFNWNPRWILSGQGDPLDLPPEQVCEDLLERLETLLGEREANLPISKKARIYGMLLKTALRGEEVPDSQIHDLVELVDN